MSGDHVGTRVGVTLKKLVDMKYTPLDKGTVLDPYC